MPEYLRLRFDEKTRGFNAILFALMTVFSSGISMYAMAKLLQLLHVFDAPFAALGLGPEYIFHVCVVASAVVVLVYVWLGGLSSAIYNEVLQFMLIVAGFVPLVYLGLRDAGGWGGIRAAVPVEFTHLWRGFGSAATSPMGVDAFGVAMGLGFVLSFGYWCTDFLVVQRAMAADSMAAARRTPLIAAVPKMLFPFLVVMPGLIALAVHGGVVPLKMHEGTTVLVLDALGKPQLDYDLTIPTLLLRYFPSGLLGLGLTALLASFMSGMAGNVTAFNTVWTYDIYQAYLRPRASDAHYLKVGRLATVFGVAASILTAYVAAQFNNIMYKNRFLRVVIRPRPIDDGMARLFDPLVEPRMHGGRFYDPHATRIAAYRRGMQAIVRGAGNSFLLGCNHPIWPSLGLIHGSRSSNDIKRTWDRIASTARQNLSRNWQNGRLWWNDPDAVVLAGDLSEAECRFHATAIYASGGMVLSGDDLTVIPPARAAMLRKLLPPAGVAAVFEDATLRLGTVRTADVHALCLFNWDDTPQTMAVRLPQPSTVTDYWSDEILGRREGTIMISMEPRSARLLKLT